MVVQESFTILPLEYFTYGNQFSGSRGEFNYKIIPKEEFRLIIWYGKNCSAKSELVCEANFPLVEESRPQICLWLAEQYERFLETQD